MLIDENLSPLPYLSGVERHESRSRRKMQSDLTEEDVYKEIKETNCVS